MLPITRTKTIFHCRNRRNQEALKNNDYLKEILKKEKIYYNKSSTNNITKKVTGEHRNKEELSLTTKLKIY